MKVKRNSNEITVELKNMTIDQESIISQGVSVKLFRGLGVLSLLLSAVCVVLHFGPFVNWELLGMYMFFSIISMIFLCFSGTLNGAVSFSFIVKIIIIIPFLLASPLYEFLYQYLQLPKVLDEQLGFYLFLCYLGGIFYVYCFLIRSLCKTCGIPNDIWVAFILLWLSCAVLRFAGHPISMLFGLGLAVFVSHAFLRVTCFRFCAIQPILTAVIYLLTFCYLWFDSLYLS